MTDGYTPLTEESLPMYNRLSSILLILTIAALTACSSGQQRPYTLTIAHLNDTHSHLEATPVNLDIGGSKTTVQLGGFPRLQTLVNVLRTTDPSLLLLHAGDAVQGTLYFTLFNGVPEFDFLNRLGVDAMTFGNHEFDRGPAAIPGFLQRAKFPLVSSNIDFSGEPTIAPAVAKAIIREVNGERIGIIGLTTETTPQTTINVGQAKFLSPPASARQQVIELERQGVNKIIALSHLGYAEDLKLAATVNGIDIIVGGHSHTLLGELANLAPLGLSPEGAYPSRVASPDGGTTLVLQAWQWGHLLGSVRVTFDSAGRVTDHTPGAIMPLGEVFSREDRMIPPDSPDYAMILQALSQSGIARVVAEEPATAAALAPYTAQLATFRKQVVATASRDLIRGPNSGPGPLVADSMLAAVPRAQVAILNYGGVRKDLLLGPISVGDLLEVMPFANSLVLVDLTGAELQRALEEDLDFLLTKYGSQTQPPLPYVAGIKLSVTPSATKGRRVGALAVQGADGDYLPIDPTATYRTVVNAFVAGGGDGFTTIKHAQGFRSDTGIIDSDAFRDHLQLLGTVQNPTAPRILVTPAP